MHAWGEISNHIVVDNYRNTVSVTTPDIETKVCEEILDADITALVAV